MTTQRTPSLARLSLLLDRFEMRFPARTSGIPYVLDVSLDTGCCSDGRKRTVDSCGLVTRSFRFRKNSGLDSAGYYACAEKPV